jgi:hypothetical protein
MIREWGAALASRRVRVAAYFRHPVADGVDALKWDAIPTPLP